MGKIKLLNYGELDINYMNNMVTRSEKTGHALQEDLYHDFPTILDYYSGYSKAFPQRDGSILYQLEGYINGVKGVFEWLVKDSKVSHRYFSIGGKITTYSHTKYNKELNRAVEKRGFILID